ncbi:hypothetical protein XENOCAPTIV_011464 [Xenoophorus captivus]|uniref:ARID domain-containing protein n=1 Tax=Xenoophorus captivus TaxID=1517983 RepID=A0ABV0SA81_9TELE
MDPMAMKRSQLYGMGNSPYSQQQGAPYPGQPYSSPSPQRYPMGMSGRGQMGMGRIHYPQQQMGSQYGPQQQNLSSYGHPGQPPYFSPPQQQPAAPSQPAYMQPCPLPPQEVPQEAYGGRGKSAAMTPGKPSLEDLSLSQQERPSSLPVLLPVGTTQTDQTELSPMQGIQNISKSFFLFQDLSRSIDDLLTGTEAAVSSGASGSGSTRGDQATPGARSPFSPHVSPRLPPLARTGPSPSPSLSPAGSRSGPLSPTSTNGPGFPPSMHRSTQGSHFGPSPMSTHPAPVGSMHHSSYQQGSHSYGPPGNYTRPPHYGGIPAAGYSGPGPSLANNMGLNTTGPMHGQGPSTPSGRGPGPGAGGRPYTAGSGTVAPTSPNMPSEMVPNSGPSANSSLTTHSRLKVKCPSGPELSGGNWPTLLSNIADTFHHELMLSLCVQKPNVATMTNEKITRLYEMGSEPERRLWVGRYLSFMEERGTPVSNLPAVGKKPLDLCRLYLAVREIGGLAMVRCYPLSSLFFEGFCPLY